MAELEASKVDDQRCQQIYCIISDIDLSIHEMSTMFKDFVTLTWALKARFLCTTKPILWRTHSIVNMLETLRSSAPKQKEFVDEEKGEFVNNPYHISNTSSQSPSTQRRSSYDRHASGSGKGKDSAEAAKKEWIRTSPHSPRNWPKWRKWWLISGLIFYTFIVFIASTGLVTSYYVDEFGVSEEVAVLGQSMFIVSRDVYDTPIGSG